MSQSEPQYWVVGAMLGGSYDIFEICIERGYWYGWEPTKNSEEIESEKVKNMRALIRQIKQGDRMAIKKQLGTTGDNAKYISIRALGIVKAVDLEEWRVYVDWLLPQKCDSKKEIGRRVPKMGVGGISTISGPFENNDTNKDWLPVIFSI